ncbi:MAG: gcvT1 [Deltaproteobacteria bacterium]|nr:gcvT1 [Deltaproteobacteria bacterium]
MNTQRDRLHQNTGLPSIQPALAAVFSDPQSEWAAVRQRCGLLDARFRGLLRLTGTDRTTFLQGMMTNDVAGLQDGQGVYAALLTIQGKVVSDLRAYALADEFWLDVPAIREATVRETLDHYIIADDVEIAADGLWAPLVAVEGPQAARTLIGVLGSTVEGMRPLDHREFTFDGARVRVAAVSHAGENGYLVFGDRALTLQLRERCHAAGAEPVGTDALNVLRLEAGIPWCGVDFDDSVLVLEAGLDAAISYQKGCYLGQEVVERVSARGQIHRKLVGLVCTGHEVPPADARLFHVDKEVGAITSAVWSPERQAVIALAYVRSACWEPTTALQIALPQGTATGQVVALPFYGRSSY